MTKTVLDRYERIVNDALNRCGAKLRKSFKTAFIQVMILYMILPRRINFTQMGRYSDSCEQRFRQLFEKDFDWMEFNTILMGERFGKGGRKAIAIDASYISKAGSKTPYIGRFWSGSVGMAKRGLEILGIGVIDIDGRDCMMLRAEQTPDKETMSQLAGEQGKDEYNLVDWYLHVLHKHKDRLLSVSPYVVADAWFSKAGFVNEACGMGYHVISRLRDDAALWYSHDGVKSGKRGRPRVKGERIDFSGLDTSKAKCLDVEGGSAYEITAYSTRMKRNIKIVVFYPEKVGTHKIYFSTDLNMSGTDIVEYYKTRFQIEFVFRDGKQFTGLNHCQARDLKKLDFAFNASLAAVNVAKIIRKQDYPSLSIGLLKSYMSNIYILKRILCRFGFRPNKTFNAKLVKELFGFVADAS